MPINPLADYLDQLPTRSAEYTPDVLREALNQIAEFKNNGTDFNQPDEDGLTPLLIAIDKHPKLVNALLDYGADPNIADAKSGTTPLHLAAFNGDKKIAEALIKRKANVNAEDNNKDTPMHMAFLSKNSELMGLLITSGANQDAINNDGNTPYGELKKDQILSKKFSDPIKQPANNKAKKSVSFDQQTTVEAQSISQSPPPSPRSITRVEDIGKPQSSNNTSDLKARNISTYISKIIDKVIDPTFVPEELPALYGKLEASLGKDLTASFKTNIKAIDQLDFDFDVDAYKKEVTGIYIKMQQELATKSAASPLITSCKSPSAPVNTPSNTRSTPSREMGQ